MKIYNILKQKFDMKKFILLRCFIWWQSQRLRRRYALRKLPYRRSFHIRLQKQLSFFNWSWPSPYKNSFGKSITDIVGDSIDTFLQFFQLFLP